MSIQDRALKCLDYRLTGAEAVIALDVMQEFTLTETAALREENRKLREAVDVLMAMGEHYAERCDACAHPRHEFACDMPASLGWTKGECGCNSKRENLAEAAMDKVKQLGV